MATCEDVQLCIVFVRSGFCATAKPQAKINACANQSCTDPGNQFPLEETASVFEGNDWCGVGKDCAMTVMLM